MRLEQVVELLQEVGFKIAVEDNLIYHDERKGTNLPLENYYALIKDGDKWNFCFVVQERRNEPEITVEKSFSIEEEALNHFFLHRLKRYYMDNYVLPHRRKLSGKKNWNENALVEAMKGLDIPITYLSTENEMNENSIYVTNTNGEWLSSFIGKDKNVIATAANGTKDENWFFELRLNQIYPLYLLDHYTAELIKKNILNHPYTDIEKANFLGYRV